jgi:hypothetical protein
MWGEGMNKQHFAGETVIILRLGPDGTIGVHETMKNFPGITEGEGVPLPSGERSTDVLSFEPVKENPDVLCLLTKTHARYIIVRQTVHKLPLGAMKRG